MDGTILHSRLRPGCVPTVTAGAVLTFAAVTWWHGIRPVNPWEPIAATALIAASGMTEIRNRIRSIRFADSWREAAYLLTLLLLPRGFWVLICVAAGVAVSFAAQRRNVTKTVYAVAANTVAAATGMVCTTDLSWYHNTFSWHGFAGLGFSGVLFVVVTTATTCWAVAEHGGGSYRQVFTELARKRWSGQLGKLAAALLLVWATDGPHQLILPPLAYLAHRHLLAHRAMNKATKARHQLSLRTLRGTTLDEVAAIEGGLKDALWMWQPDHVQADIEDTRGVVWYWTAGDTEQPHRSTERHTSPGFPIERPLSHGDTTLGVLRLLFAHPVPLSVEETWELDMFTTSLSAAILNTRLAAHHEHASTHDDLTDLSNRRALTAELTAAIDAADGGCCTGLLLVDLRDFKRVNTSLGHASADQVLIDVADRLRSAGSRAHLAARLTGDEFAVLLSGYGTEAEARDEAANIIEALRKPYKAAGINVSFGLSTGFACAPYDSRQANELLRCAEVALIGAKTAREDGIVRYRPEHDPTGLAQLSLLAELQAGIRVGELYLDYQPSYDLTTTQVISVEALVRWNHPRRGLLRPHEFLPAAERGGISRQITDAVLDMALADCSTWARAGIMIPVAVNITSRDLHDSTLPDTIGLLLGVHDVAPTMLTVELTETMISSRLDPSLGVLADLRRIGVHAACNDFGAGASSLARLQDLPLDRLKIDKSLIVGLSGDPRKKAIVQAIVDVAEAFELSVTGGGIETAADLDALVALGCLSGQGFHLSAPVSPATLAGMLAGPHRVLDLT